MRKEKHMVPILVQWLSEGSHLLCYQNAVLRLFTTSHLCGVWHSMSHICMGGRNVRAEREPLLQTLYHRGETSGRLGEATD